MLGRQRRRAFGLIGSTRGDRRYLRQVDATRAIGRLDLVKTKNGIKQLAGGGLMVREGKVVVGHLGGAGDEGGHGQEDTKRVLDLVLYLDDLGERDGHVNLKRQLLGGGGGGSVLLGCGCRLLLGDLDVAQVEVSHVVETGRDGGRSVGVDGAEVGENIALEQAPIGAGGLDLVEVGLANAVALDQVLDRGEQRILLLKGLVARGGLSLLAFTTGRLGLGLLVRGGRSGLGGGRRGGRLGLRIGRDLEAGNVVSGLGEDGDASANGDGLAAVLGHDLHHDTVLLGLDIHGGLVRLNLEQDVAGAKVFALLDAPAGDISLGHGRRQCGHYKVLGGEASCRGREACGRGATKVPAVSKKGMLNGFEGSPERALPREATRPLATRTEARQAVARDAIAEPTERFWRRLEGSMEA